MSFGESSARAIEVDQIGAGACARSTLSMTSVRPTPRRRASGSVPTEKIAGDAAVDGEPDGADDAAVALGDEHLERAEFALGAHRADDLHRHRRRVPRLFAVHAIHGEGERVPRRLVGNALEHHARCARASRAARRASWRSADRARSRAGVRAAPAPRARRRRRASAVDGARRRRAAAFAASSSASSRVSSRSRARRTRFAS